MKVVYIAGPFRAENTWMIEQNIRRAESLALEVWKLGAAVVCPHANTRFFQNAAPDKVWLDGDLEILKRCDAILMTDDWKKSSGAIAEKNFAVEKGIPVFYNLEEINTWLNIENFAKELKIKYPPTQWKQISKKEEPINIQSSEVFKETPSIFNNFNKENDDDILSVCEIADKLVNPEKGERSKAYGHPLDDYTRTTKTFNALTGKNLTPEEGILFMLCVKMSREVNSGKRDNLIDICGYAKCLDILHKERKNREEKI